MPPLDNDELFGYLGAMGLVLPSHCRLLKHYSLSLFAALVELSHCEPPAVSSTCYFAISEP